MLPIRSFILICSVVTAVGCNTGDAPVSISPNTQSDSAAASSRGRPDRGATSVETRPVPPSPPIAILRRVLDDAHLHNVFRIHEKVLSGAARRRRRISAVGIVGSENRYQRRWRQARCRAGQKHGLSLCAFAVWLRWHPEERRELAKAVRDLDGPIYIHCHHGKHRSPAGAAVACVAAGSIAPENALGILQAAGTSKEYRGLYDSAERGTPLDQKLLDEFQVDFKDSVHPALGRRHGSHRAHARSFEKLCHQSVAAAGPSSRPGRRPRGPLASRALHRAFANRRGESATAGVSSIDAGSRTEQPKASRRI